MSKKEIALFLGVTERTVESWMRSRFIPYIKIGQTVRFRVASVLRYVDEKCAVPAANLRQRRKNESGGQQHWSR